MLFSEIFIQIANMAIKSQNQQDGSMLGGHNGPYYDPETPVRNSSHWAISFIKAWELSGDKKFKVAAQRSLDFLLFDKKYRGDFTFSHRNQSGKDQCNGLIGPAWNMEALIEGYRTFSDERYLALAKKLFLLHPFCQRQGLWYRVEPDGSILSIDYTFNHQLWFCATASPLIEDSDERIAGRINRFAERIKVNFGSWGEGRIAHPCWTPNTRLKEKIKRLVRSGYREHILLKEVGYHAFNLYAFALWFKEMPQLSFFKSKPFNKSLDYLDHSEFRELIEQSSYGFPYNPPGFEVPFVKSIFVPEFTLDEGMKWLRKQLSTNLISSTWVFGNNTEDPLTMTSRLYESSRLPDEFYNANF